jgi:hypothetical protein
MERAAAERYEPTLAEAMEQAGLPRIPTTKDKTETLYARGAANQDTASTRARNGAAPTPERRGGWPLSDEGECQLALRPNGHSNVDRRAGFERRGCHCARRGWRGLQRRRLAGVLGEPVTRRLHCFV